MRSLTKKEMNYVLLFVLGFLAGIILSYLTRGGFIGF